MVFTCTNYEVVFYLFSALDMCLCLWALGYRGHLSPSSNSQLRLIHVCAYDTMVLIVGSSGPSHLHFDIIKFSVDIRHLIQTLSINTITCL